MTFWDDQPKWFPPEIGSRCTLTGEPSSWAEKKTATCEKPPQTLMTGVVVCIVFKDVTPSASCTALDPNATTMTDAI